MRGSMVVGRVGALAVALGVGTALATGVASADTTDPESPGTTSVSADAQPESPPAGAPETESRKADATEIESTETSGSTSRRGLQPGVADLERTIRRFVERGVAMSTGGALSSARAARDTT